MNKNYWPLMGEYDFNPQQPLAELPRRVVQPPPEPPLQKFLDAFEGKVIPLDNVERRGINIALPKQATTDQPLFSLQHTSLDGNGAFRMEIADGATRDLILANGGNFNVQVAIREGGSSAKGNNAQYKNPIFQQTTTAKPDLIRCPLVGISIPLHAQEVYVDIFNTSGGPAAETYYMAFSVLERRVQRDPTRRQSNSGARVLIPELSAMFSVSVPGGVVAGDVIEVVDITNAVLRTFPAREGGVWGIGFLDSTVRYVPIGAPVVDMVWLFERVV